MKPFSQNRLQISNTVRTTDAIITTTMSAILREAFGSDEVDLYKDVLKVDRECTPAQLRKAYYKQALKFHPDRTTDNSEASKLKFQAISFSYQLLKDPEKRAEYDRDGSLPEYDDDDDGDEKGGAASWKSYFDLIFGKVTTNDIDNFAMKYKMSEEEEADVLKQYEEFKGDLKKMLEFVMLSEERDCQRWW